MSWGDNGFETEVCPALQRVLWRQHRRWAQLWHHSGSKRALRSHAQRHEAPSHMTSYQNQTSPVTHLSGLN